MAQRWMQAKEELARKHGTMRSGANRATGEVWDDLRGKRGKYDEENRGFHPITGKKPKVTRLAPEDRPVPFGRGRKEQRKAAHLARLAAK